LRKLQTVGDKATEQALYDKTQDYEQEQDNNDILGRDPTGPLAPLEKPCPSPIKMGTFTFPIPKPTMEPPTNSLLNSPKSPP
jgi:hypothetical protein